MIIGAIMRLDNNTPSHICPACLPPNDGKPPKIEGNIALYNDAEDAKKWGWKPCRASLFYGWHKKRAWVCPDCVSEHPWWFWFLSIGVKQ